MYLSISNNEIIDKSCSYCNKPFTNEFWCKECDPRRIIEGWSSENPDIDMFIKATIYNVRHVDSSPFLEWVSFDKFIDINQIGEGGFSKVYSAIWMDGKSSYKKRNNESWIKLESEPIKVALKKLNGSQNMSTDYLNKVEYIFITSTFRSSSYYEFTVLSFLITLFNNRLKYTGIFIQTILVF